MSAIRATQSCCCFCIKNIGDWLWKGREPPRHTHLRTGRKLSDGDVTARQLTAGANSDRHTAVMMDELRAAASRLSLSTVQGVADWVSLRKCVVEVPTLQLTHTYAAFTPDICNPDISCIQLYPLSPSTSVSASRTLLVSIYMYLV